MQLRIDTTYDNKVSGYKRSTDYLTAEVGETYKDGDTKWERKTFTSRVDNVTITSITNSSKNVSLTLSIDNISSMSGFGLGSDSGQTDEKNIQYKELVADDGSYLAQVAHYPNYENSSLKEGGFAAVTYIVIDGGTKTANKDNSSDSYNKSGYDASVSIKDAKAVYLITALDRTKEMGKMSDFASATSYAIQDSLLEQVQGVAKKYGNFSYSKALKPSAKAHSELFNSATLVIADNAATDANDSNTKLIEAQKASDKLSTTLSNRVYNQGRYAMICCAGYSMSRLCGMWIGDISTQWMPMLIYNLQE